MKTRLVRLDLDLIRDQGDRQFDLIGNFNTGTKSIEFENKRLSRLKKETDNKEDETKANKNSEKKKKEIKQFLILQHETELLIILVIIEI